MLAVAARMRCLVPSIAALLAVSACQSDAPAVATAPARGDDAPAVASSRSPSTRDVKTLDDRYAELAVALPGFAGMFRGADGAVTTLMADSVPHDVVRARISRFLQRERLKADEVTNALHRMRIQRARFDFPTLHEWHRDRVAATVHRMSGVTLSAIDHRNNRIVVGVDRPSARFAVAAAIRRLGIPDDAIHITSVQLRGPTGRASLNPFAPVPATLEDLEAPSPGGMRISYSWNGFMTQCTLGYNVLNVANGVPVDSYSYFITNGHCSPSHGGIDPITMYQPAGGGNHAREIVDPPPFTSAENPNCPPDRACRFADVALYRWEDASFGDKGKIAKTLIGSTGITGRYYIMGSADPLINESVNMVGATSGMTSGQVDLPCAIISYPSSTKTYICAAVARYFSQDGDSGGPIFRPGSEPNVATALGITFARAEMEGHGEVSFFSPMSMIEQAIYAGSSGQYGISPISPVPPPPPITYSASISGRSTIRKADYNCVWTASTNVPNPSYTWWVGGGLIGSGPTVSYGLANTGSFTLELQVTSLNGGAGATASKTVNVTLNATFCTF